MNPARKRKVRLVVALSTALLLASALVYTSFSAATETQTPSQLLRNAAAGDVGQRSVELTGKVAAGSVERSGDTLRFAIRDRKGGAAKVPVVYEGAVPDPFRVGREVIVTGKLQDGTFVAERDSLITKCPSKFQAKPGASKE